MQASAAALAVKRVPTCAICGQEILSVRIACAECSPGIELCLPCLAAGREARGGGGPAAQHVRTHRYRVLDNLAAMHLYEREHPPARPLQQRFVSTAAPPVL